MAGPLPAGRPGRAGRPVQPPPSDAAADPSAGGAQGRAPADYPPVGPVQIGARLGLAASTVHRVLVRVGRNRLASTDRATGLPVRRYEHPAPGCLVHLDVKKLGNIPQAGGHRIPGRQLGKRHSQADKAPVRSHSPPAARLWLPACRVDDHSRLAYVEVHPDEQAATACGSGPGRMPGSPSVGSWSSKC